MLSGLLLNAVVHFYDLFGEPLLEFIQFGAESVIGEREYLCGENGCVGRA